VNQVRDKHEEAESRTLLATCSMLVSCLVYYSTVKIEAKLSSETSVDFQRNTGRCMPGDRTFLLVFGEEYAFIH
jgi:hypothetical protein